MYFLQLVSVYLNLGCLSQKSKTFGRYAGAFKPDKSRKAFVFTCSCFCMWPGNLINPRQVEYVGEARLEYQHGKFHGFSFLPPFYPGILLAVSFFFDGRIFLMDSSNMVLKWDATIEMWLVRMWSSMGMVPSRWSLLVRIEILKMKGQWPFVRGAICSDRFGFFWVLFQKMEQARQDHANELEDLNSVQHVLFRVVSKRNALRHDPTCSIIDCKACMY